MKNSLDKYWDKPKGLSESANKACDVIRALALLRKWDTGDQFVFRSPEEHKDMGEEYGRNSELIIVHDGGDLAPRFNLDHQQYEEYDKMVQALKEVGVWSEGCTCWYSAIYEL